MSESLKEFPARWRAELLTKARKELKQAQGFLGALKIKTTGYYRAHEMVVALKQAALSAMESVPLTEDELEATTPHPNTGNV